MSSPSGNAPAARGGRPEKIRPRVPALVKREVAESRDEEDTKRMAYRGFDKSKLNASRKQKRKEARDMKKLSKAQRQQDRSMAHEKMKKLQQENLQLQRLLGAQMEDAASPAGAASRRKPASETVPRRPPLGGSGTAEQPAKKRRKKNGSRRGSGAAHDTLQSSGREAEGDGESTGRAAAASDDELNLDNHQHTGNNDEDDSSGADRSDGQEEGRESENDSEIDGPEEQDSEREEGDEGGAGREYSQGKRTRGGETKAVGAGSESEVVQKYVPPHLRKQMLGEASADAKLQAAVRNRLNKVSEGNLSSIATELTQLYSSYPRSLVDRQLAEIVMELSGEGVGRIIGQFAALYAALVAALHGSVGAAVGARFLERLVRELDGLLQRDNPGAEAINLSLIFGHLYLFKVVACSLVYDFVRMLVQRFTDGALDMLLALLRVTGTALRADDPTALRDIIQLVRSRANAEGAAAMLSARGRFVLDFIYDLQNNRVKKSGGAGTGISANAAEEVRRLAKWLQDYCKRAVEGGGGQLQVLRPGWQELVSPEGAGGRLGAGQWWEQGTKLEPIKMKRSGAKDFNGETEEGVSFGNDREAQLKQVASKHKMGSEVRKAVFMVMMSSEDYLDATEKLLRLSLPETQAREIVRVAFHCCCHEQGWNPFYAYLLTHLCSLDKHHQFTLRLCFWDAFKEMSGWAESTAGKAKIANVAQLLAHAWIGKALSLSLLKPVEIEQMGAGGHLCLTLAFRALVLQGEPHSLAKLVQKIAGGDRETAELRAGLKWFFYKHMNAQKGAARHAGFGGGADLPSGKVAADPKEKKLVLAQRVKVFVDLLEQCGN